MKELEETALTLKNTKVPSCDDIFTERYKLVFRHWPNLLFGGFNTCLMDGTWLLEGGEIRSDQQKVRKFQAIVCVSTAVYA